MREKEIINDFLNGEKIVNLQKKYDLCFNTIKKILSKANIKKEDHICSELTETQKSYIAGIIDGEGSIQIQRRKSKENYSGEFYGMTVYVANTHFGLIDYLKETTTIGNTCVSKRKGNRKPQKVWRVHSNQIEFLLEQIFPYLIIKKEQAKIMLRFRELISFKYGMKGCPEHIKMEKEDLWKRIKDLNKRGKR